MKLSKKKILALAIAVCLLATLSMGTLAWFSDKDSVTNNFLVGDSTTAPDKVFGIDVWEEVDTDRDPATELETVGKGDTTENTADYKAILPGEVMTKKPYLTNTGIHPQYIRAIVTVTEADILKDAMIPKGADVSEWFDVAKFLPGTGDKWSREYTYYTNKDTFVFVYYYTETLAAGATTQPVFDAVVVPTELTKEQAAEMDTFTVTVVGEAIQSEHLADVANAKEAFAKYWDEEGVVAGVTSEDLATGDGTVSVSYPVTGDLGTVKEDLITYDNANYTDPDNPGVLMMTDVKATVKSGADLIVIPAEESNVTILMVGANYTVEDGAKIVDCPHGTGGIYVRDVYINGEKITRDNRNAMSEKYFSGLSIMFA